MDLLEKNKNKQFE